MRRQMTRIGGLILGVASLLAVGCSSDDGTETGSATGTGTGELTVILDHGGAIFDGLTPGDEAINIRDGWNVSVDQYIVAVGAIDVHLATDESVEFEASDVFVVDLAQLPTNGLPLWTISGLGSGRWEFNYRTPGAADGSTRHDTVDQADYDMMVSNDWTYLIRGTLENADGQSCPPQNLATPGDKTANGNVSGQVDQNPCYDATSIKFDIGAQVETDYGPCEIDEVPGFSITDGGTQTVAATVHGDHPFFNGFPEGDEGGVLRLAQWLADCDLNLDGTVTKEELEAIAPSMLPEIDERYQLGGSPITPLNTMYDFVMAQLKTQGHFQGEGECPADGVAHNHAHGDDGHDHADHSDEHDDHGDDHTDGDDHSDHGHDGTDHADETDGTDHADHADEADHTDGTDHADEADHTDGTDHADHGHDGEDKTDAADHTDGDDHADHGHE